MAKITADTLIAHGETVAEAVAVHGEDLDALLEKLNAGIN